MSYLLDTHAFLWWLFDDPNLSSTARGLLVDPQNPVFVSSATVWEIATKFRLGRLASASTLVQDIPVYVAKAGFRELPIQLSHAQRAGAFPQAHRDPVDRMLAAQAGLESLILISKNPALEQFGVRVVW